MLDIVLKLPRYFYLLTEKPVALFFQVQSLYSKEAQQLENDR